MSPWHFQRLSLYIVSLYSKAHVQKNTTPFSSDNLLCHKRTVDQIGRVHPWSLILVQWLYWLTIQIADINCKHTGLMMQWLVPNWQICDLNSLTITNAVHYLNIQGRPKKAQKISHNGVYCDLTTVVFPFFPLKSHHKIMETQFFLKNLFNASRRLPPFQYF